MKPEQMPILRPLPIKTSGLPWYKRVKVWQTTPRQWEVMEDWYFTLPNGQQIMIPKGFIFDGASVPRVLWWFLNPIGILLIPGLIHDYGYRFDMLIGVEEDNSFFTYMHHAGKKAWDNLFKEIGFQVNGLAGADTIAYVAVKFGGSSAWNARRKGLPETR